MRTILLLVVSALVLTSCEINNSYPEELTTKQVFRFEVKARDWQQVTDQGGLNRYYKSSFEINGISDYIINNGAVIGYIEFDGFQQTLPYTRHYENFDGAKWTRTIDYDFSRTNVHFYVTNNDFIADPPETMFFRVIFIW